MKPWYRSKMMWLNIIGILVTSLQELINVFPDGKFSKIMLLIIAGGNIILRTQTYQGIERIGNQNRS